MADYEMDVYLVRARDGDGDYTYLILGERGLEKNFKDYHNRSIEINDEILSIEPVGVLRGTSKLAEEIRNNTFTEERGILVELWMG